MYRNKNFDQNEQNLKTANQSTKLAIIASAVTTFGDALSTSAANTELGRTTGTKGSRRF